MLEMLLTSSALIGAIVLIRRVFRRRISLRLRYALWLLAAVRLLVPGSLFQSPLSIAEGARPVVERVEAYCYAPERQTVYVPVEKTQADPVSALDQEQLQALAGGKGQVVAVGPATAQEAGGTEGQSYVRVDVEVPRDHLFWAKVIWGAGIAAMALWFVVTNVRFRLRLRRTALPVPIEGRLPVYVMPGLSSPCLCGLLRPAIYITPECARDEAGLRHILAHEYAHYRHGDQFWALVRCVCLTVWWFNPLVWLAAVLSRRDCELACDEAAVKALGEEERLAYGRTLVGVVAAAGSPAAIMQTATTMTGGKKSIRERITLIAHRPKMTAAALACTLLIAALVVGCAFGGARGGAEETDSLEALLSGMYGTYYSQRQDFVGPVVVSYIPMVDGLTISERFFGCADQDGYSWGDNITDPIYTQIAFERENYGQSDGYYPALDEFFGRYESIAAFEVENATRPLHLLLLDGELWMAMMTEEGGCCYIVHLVKPGQTVAPEDVTALGETPAAQAQRVYNTVVGTDENLDFYIEVNDAAGTRLHITPGNGSNVPDGESCLGRYNWQTTFAGSTPSGTALTLESADGGSWLRCWADSNLVLLHQNGQDTWMTAAQPEPGTQSVYQLLLGVAQEAMYEWVFDVDVTEQDLNDPAARYGTVLTGDRGVLYRYGELVVENLKNLPEWVKWKPEEAALCSISVTQAYFYGDMPNFCGTLSIYLKGQALSASHFEAGGGIQEVESGEYAGWGCYTIGTGFYYDGAGTYVCYARYTGGEQLILPTDMRTASLEELLHDILFTSGSYNWYTLPYMVFTRFAPEEVCTALTTFHPDGVDWQARQVARSLGDFLREYGGSEEGLPAFDEVYALLDSRLQKTFREGITGEKEPLIWTPNDL